MSARSFPGDEARVRRLSLIDESGERYVRMAHLAAVGSHAINGVAALHTELLKTHVLRDFYELTPGEVQQQDQRRHAAPLDGPRQSAAGAACSPRASATAGFTTSKSCASSNRLLDDPELAREWRAIKHHNKQRLAAYIYQTLGIAVDPDSMFDVLVKRLHEYKRQHLKVLHILTLYKRIQHNPDIDHAAAHLHLRRQGRARLSHGQAHHQAHPLRRRGHSWRSRSSATASRSSSCPTSTSSSASASIPPPTSRSRSPSPARKPRAPAT